MLFKLSGTVCILLLFFSVSPALTQTPLTEPPLMIELVPIKGGCYQMGDSVGDGDPNERPVHQVCVSDFSIGKFEVTNTQYKAFDPDHDSGISEETSLDGGNQPVVNVSWEDAVAFTKWLSIKTEQSYRLPTEAEWEYAARAGSDKSRYWGNNPDVACKFANVADLTAKRHWAKWTTFPCDDGFAVSAPVGSFLPNNFGLYDMLGNVWEWCEDIYNSEAYSKLPINNPVYGGSGEYRVMRGGGWSNGPLGIRSSHRVGLSPGFGHHSLGFRIVRSPQ